MKEPVLLCYNLDADSTRKTRLAAMRLKIRLRNVHPWEQHISLESLCNLPTSPEGEAAADAFADEMLVMAYFPNGLMQTLLQLLRRSGVPSIPLKAVLTETNATWDSVMLHGEIAREREAILQGGVADHSDSSTQMG